MFRLVNVRGRTALEHDGGFHDLATLTGDDSLRSAVAALAQHRRLHDLQSQCALRAPEGLVKDVTFGPPVPDPRQVFGIGLNYRSHAEEGGMALPPAPLTFTKFPSCLAGPTEEIVLSGEAVDYEAEAVVVIGDDCRHVQKEVAWDVVAGVMAGQDVSDRTVQFTGSPPQFCLGKSFVSYGPIGPAVVSVDALASPDDLTLHCDLNGETVQEASTSQLIFDVPTLVSYLSSICRLYPGDLIFTGTPEGVGVARGRLLREGDVIVTNIDGIGELRNRCVAAPKGNVG